VSEARKTAKTTNTANTKQLIRNILQILPKGHFVVRIRTVSLNNRLDLGLLSKICGTGGESGNAFCGGSGGGIDIGGC